MNEFFNNKDLLQLLIHRIDDGLTYFRLMQVNKLTNKICKQFLIHKKGNNGKRSHLRSWTEIPGLPGLVNGQIIRVDARGKVMYRFGYINGLQHGISIKYRYPGSDLFQFKLRYLNGQVIENILLTEYHQKNSVTRTQPIFSDNLKYFGLLLVVGTIISIPLYFGKLIY